MFTRDQKTIDPGRPAETTIEDQHAAAHADDACRCKEVSEKTPGELLRMMFNDLAFWNKMKKE